MCVCCRLVYGVHVCACLVTRLYSRTQKHSCNHYYFFIFIMFLTLSTFNIDLIGPPRDEYLFVMMLNEVAF